MNGIMKSVSPSALTDPRDPWDLQVCVLAFAPWGGSPEGVPEVHAPPLQLLGVVGRHVGKLPEDVQVGGVSWGDGGTQKELISRGFATVSPVFIRQKRLFCTTKAAKGHHHATPPRNHGNHRTTSITKPVQPLCVWRDLSNWE